MKKLLFLIVIVTSGMLANIKPKQGSLLRLAQLHRTWILIVLVTAVLGSCDFSGDIADGDDWNGEEMEVGLYYMPGHGQDRAVNLYYEAGEMRLQDYYGYPDTDWEVMPTRIKDSVTEYKRVVFISDTWLRFIAHTQKVFRFVDHYSGEEYTYSFTENKNLGTLEVLKRSNFRDHNHRLSNVLHVLDPGDRLIHIGGRDEWYFVRRADGQVGWVHESLVKKVK